MCVPYSAIYKIPLFLNVFKVLTAYTNVLLYFPSRAPCSRQPTQGSPEPRASKMPLCGRKEHRWTRSSAPRPGRPPVSKPFFKPLCTSTRSSSSRPAPDIQAGAGVVPGRGSAPHSSTPWAMVLTDTKVRHHNMMHPARRTRDCA